MAGITLILRLVYKAGIYILDIISGLVPETGTDRRLWYCIRSDWSLLQYQYPYQYYILKLQPVYWYNTGSYRQPLFMHKLFSQ